MAIVNKNIPRCDECGKMWLPEETKDDGTRNPAFDDPSLCRRCSRCKSASWNRLMAGDKRRKRKGQASEVPPQSEVQPIDQPLIRCRHQLLRCGICHPEAA